MRIENYSFPTEDPLLILLMLIIAVYLAPLLFRKISLPGIIGLIVSGVIMGPAVLNLMERNLVIIFFQKIGLIYLMFLASLELDIQKVKKNTFKSSVFGILTFLIPFMIGTPVSHYLLGYDWLSSILLAIMFSTHTLVAYPVVSRKGITKNEVVSVAVGGTIITDTLVLLVLALISAFKSGEMNHYFIFRMSGSIIIFAVIVLYLFPIFARWFFKNAEPDRSIQFLFIFFLMILSAVLAELAGMDGIIGAFLVGLSLNRLIKSHHSLLGRIEFFGNTFFIPFFLVSVGMLVNLNIAFQSSRTIYVIVVLTVFAFLTKWIAAFVTQKLLNYNSLQRKLLFGLSSTHAAAILAVIIIGLKIGLFDEYILNATIILILVTCLIGSFVTEKAAREIAISSENLERDEPEMPLRILVPVANPATVDKLMDLAIILQRAKPDTSLYVLSVVNDDDDVYQKVLESKKLMNEIARPAVDSDIQVNIRTKVDLNVASGIIRAVKEHTISTVIMGWSGKKGTVGKIFGSTLDNVLNAVNEELLICKLSQKCIMFSSVYCLIPTNFSFEPGYNSLLKKFILIAKQVPASPVFYSDRRTLQLLKNNPEINQEFFNPEFRYSPWDEKFRSIFEKINNHSLVLIMLAKKGSVSYRQEHDLLPQIINEDFPDMNVIIAYPKQFPELTQGIILPEEDIGLDPIQDNINRLSRMGGKLARLLRIKRLVG